MVGAVAGGEVIGGDGRVDVGSASVSLSINRVVGGLTDWISSPVAETLSDPPRVTATMMTAIAIATTSTDNPMIATVKPFPPPEVAGCGVPVP